MSGLFSFQYSNIWYQCCEVISKEEFSIMWEFSGYFVNFRTIGDYLLLREMCVFLI